MPQFQPFSAQRVMVQLTESGDIREEEGFWSKMILLLGHFERGTFH